MNIQGLIWLIVSGVLNNHAYRWMGMRGEGAKNENICFERDLNPHHAGPRKESQRIRTPGHAG